MAVGGRPAIKNGRPQDVHRKSMEAKPGFEPGVKALQASALPLGHFAVYAKGRLSSALAHTMERTTGLEPATPTLARLCSTN